MSDRVEHPLSYRHEILEPLFHQIKSGESCVIVGTSSMGKTRLIDYIERPDVQSHYLGEKTASTCILRVDCNRLAEFSAWGFYELLLTTLVEGCNFSSEMINLREQVILNRDSTLLAFRNLETAVRKITTFQKARLVFLLDEFDALYRELPELDLHHLRSMRDSNKKQNYGLMYVLFMRQPPSFLRDVNEGESFFELISRSVMGIKPYSIEDALSMLRQLEDRLGSPLDSETKLKIIQQSGGHPGLIRVLFGLHTSGEFSKDEGAFNNQPDIIEECRKIWNGLSIIEREALKTINNGSMPEETGLDLLKLKGLILVSANKVNIFSPILISYLNQMQPEKNHPLRIDEKTRTVYVENRMISDLAALEFTLITYLYHHLGQVCNRDDVIHTIYPAQKVKGLNGKGVSNASFDSLVRRVRQKIEPDPKNPRYLHTVHTIGYRLTDLAE